MALLQDLIQQIDDPTLRDRILQETDKLMKQKKFGLVFEEHLPECTPLYDVPIRVGSKVALKTGYVSDIYTVVKIDDAEVLCDRRETHEKKTFQLDELVVVAEFGEPIYPTLKPLDSVENAPDSGLWHTLIEADNYHALQLLEYLYAEKVDCIYIDPPYNTGAKDWKYNNDYVDSSDAYRHSKWLSMMEKRLKIAKKLLNPKDSVMIVTIDEKEYLHLGCLLEELFPDARIQMVTDVINKKGVVRDKDFSRVEEYLFFVKIGAAEPCLSANNMLDESQESEKFTGTTWLSLQRFGSSSLRVDRPNMCYPIFVDEKKKRIIDVGVAPDINTPVESIEFDNGFTPVWPMTLGKEGRWQLGRNSVIKGLAEGTVRLGNKQKDGHWTIQYLNAGAIKELREGSLISRGKDENGALIVERVSNKLTFIKSVWYQSTHDASAYGSGLLLKIFGDKKFAFPKSVYSTEDAIRFFVSNKPNALIVDFFAGSGTTLNAVNLLNAEDGGERRCVLVTNNEVSEDEAKDLTSRGHKPGDMEWESLGIAHHVTWPRTVCTIEGHDIKGQPLKGNYLTVDIPMSDGFKANVAFSKLSFLDKTSVALGRQFRELLPVLWMKGGAIGRCPALESDELPEMLILPQNKMVVLIDEIYYSEFDAELSQHPEIQTVFIVTDSETAYRSMIRTYDGKVCYQLYRDYLDNFRINTGR